MTRLTRLGIGFQSFMGIVTGLFILLLGVLGYWAFGYVAGLVRQVPLVGSVILEWVRILDFPGGPVFFPAVGIFLIVWGVALGTKKGWARIVGIALYILFIVYLVALAILVIPLANTSFVTRYRWLILAVGVALLLTFAIQLYFLAGRRETEEMFAERYIGKRVVTHCDRCETHLDQRGYCPKCEVRVGPGSEGQVPRKRRRTEPDAKPSAGARPEGIPEAGDSGVLGPYQAIAVLRSPQRDYEMRRSRFTIGREEGNDLVLSDGTVSGYHAEIKYQEAQFVIEDLESTNGTYVNGTKVTRSRLESGSEVEFGRVKFTFEIVVQG